MLVKLTMVVYHEIYGVSLTTPLGHKMLRSLIEVQAPNSESSFVCLFQALEVCLFLFSSIL